MFPHKNSVISIIFISVIATLVFFLFPKPTQAEIATARDWIGLFSSGVSGACTSADTVITCRGKTVGGTSWGYPSNKTGNNCAQTPGIIPVLSDLGGCSFVLPPAGNYEIRMYAYDGGTPDMLIAVLPITVAGASPPPGGGSSCPAQSTNPRVSGGLISAPNISSKYGNPNANCVVGNQASFVPFKIPVYDDLKALYFDQAIVPSNNLTIISGSQTQSSGISPINLSTTSAPISGKLYNVTGDLTINYNIIPINETGMVFVDGTLTINTNLTHANENVGLVLLSKGDINIASTVTRIDAVLIAGGKIYTAGAGCIRNSVSANQLVINGSLITLDSSNNIVFCRVMADNNTPAEKIVQQPKYLVILRNILSTTLQKWAEIQ